ncbi:MAG: c-type cytochrome, partial [Verrucomicrobiota bacterium]
PKGRPLVLAALLANKNRVPALVAALKAGTVKPGDLSEVQREQLAKSGEEAKKLLARTKGNNQLTERLDRYREALASPVDLVKGKALFRQTCLTCHRLGEEGTDVGPALGSLTTKPDASILTDILDPAGKIDPEYTLYLITLNNDETLAGVVPSESPTSLTLKLADGSTRSVLRKDIATMTSADISLMPANLHEVISPEAMPSLIGYLRKAYGEIEKPE